MTRYKASMETAEGAVRLTGEVDFLDPAAEPVPPTGGTLTGAVTLTPANKDTTPLTIKPVAGATADSTIMLEIDDDAGGQVFYIDAAGDGALNMPSAVSSFFAFQRDGVAILEIDAGSGGRVVLSPAGLLDITSAVVKMTGLPAADPHVVGQLWNSAGTLTISAG